MIIPLFVILGTFSVSSQSQIKPCIFLTPHGVSVEREDICFAQADESLWAKKLMLSGLSELPGVSSKYLVHREIYDPLEFLERKNLWDQIISGSVKEGDLVSLGDYKSVVKNDRLRLYEKFGFDLGEVTNEQAAFAFVRKVTLVNKNGERISVSLTPLSTPGFGSVPSYPHNGFQSSTPPDFKRMASGELSVLSISHFGFAPGDLERFSEISQIFMILQDKQFQEVGELKRLDESFGLFLRSAHPRLADGSKELNEEEVQQIKELLMRRPGDWSSFQIADSQTIPALRLRFRNEEGGKITSYTNPYLMLERSEKRTSFDRP